MAEDRNLFISEIRDADRVEGTFLVKFKALHAGKSGKPYLNVVLMDRTGEIEARVWDDAEAFDKRFDRDDFVRVRGRAQSYQSRLQLHLHSIERCAEDEIDAADYLPATRRDVAAMEAELRGVILGMGDPWLRGLLTAFLDDPDLGWRIRRAPAARTMHHAFIGGLLEHTLSAMKLARVTVAHYQAEGYAVNADLVLTGIFLHDIGKIFELTYRRSFDYTTAGKLVGHIVMGVEMVNERAARIPGFPEELRLLVNHLIVSHHGELEYGSPRRPKTLEALIVHALDDLDARMNSFSAAMERDRDAEGDWTAYHKMYNRFLYKKVWRSPEPEADALGVAGAGGERERSAD